VDFFCILSRLIIAHVSLLDKERGKKSRRERKRKKEKERENEVGESGVTCNKKKRFLQLTSSL